MQKQGFMKRATILAAVIVFFASWRRGGGGSSSNTPTATAASGYIMDSPVEGFTHVSSSQGKD